MSIMLDHLIVPSRDPDAGAQFLGELLGVAWDEANGGPFSPVYVSDTLTIDFAQGEGFNSHHYCFHVSEEEFDAIHARLLERSVGYRSSPHGPMDMQINRRNGGKNLYWFDPDGHNWEILTVSYARRPLTAAQA